MAILCKLVTLPHNIKGIYYYGFKATTEVTSCRWIHTLAHLKWAQLILWVGLCYCCQIYISASSLQCGTKKGKHRSKETSGTVLALKTCDPKSRHQGGLPEEEHHIYCCYLYINVTLISQCWKEPQKSQNALGWKGPLEVISSNSPAQAGPPTEVAQDHVPMASQRQSQKQDLGVKGCRERGWRKGGGKRECICQSKADFSQDHTAHITARLYWTTYFSPLLGRFT